MTNVHLLRGARSPNPGAVGLAGDLGGRGQRRQGLPSIRPDGVTLEGAGSLRSPPIAPLIDGQVNRDATPQTESPGSSLRRRPLSRDIRKCPVAVMRRDLPGDGHQTCAQWLAQGDHALSADGLGEADAVAAGLADVGVVHQPEAVAVARVLGISSSNPSGCRLELTATLRRL